MKNEVKYPFNYNKSNKDKVLTLQDFQKDVIKSDYKNTVITAGRRGAKTTTLSYVFKRKVLKDYTNYVLNNDIEEVVKNIKEAGEGSYPLVYWIVSPTYSLTKIVKEALHDVLPPEFITRKYNKTDKSLVLFDIVLIEFKSANNSENNVGRKLNGIWTDETAKMKKEFIEYVLPARDDTDGWFISSTTPEGQNHYYFDIVLNGDFINAGGEREDYKHLKGWKNYYWTTADNKAVPSLVKAFEFARKNLPKRSFLREYMARFDVFQGQVYEEFSTPNTIIKTYKETFNKKEKTIEAKINGKKETLKFSKLYMFKDWGSSKTSAGASLVAGLTKDGKHLIILEELYVLNKIPDYPSADMPNQDSMLGRDTVLVDYWGITEIIADNNRIDSVDAYILRFSKRGIVVKVAYKVAGSVAMGIEQVAKSIKVPEDEINNELYKTWLLIDKDCRQLLFEFNNYKYKKGSEEPVKENDHLLDSLRYGIVEILEYRIEKGTKNYVKKKKKSYV